MAMKKGENFNRPKKGSVISVSPIRYTEDIRLIKNQLKKTSLMEYTLFVVGINTNLRPVDLCNLKNEEVKNAIVNDMPFYIREQKTKKKRLVVLNKACQKACQQLQQSTCNSIYLFHRKNGHKLTSPNITALVKKWCESIQLEGNYGGHTLRKTWGFQQYRLFNAKLPDLMKCYNHSSQKQTLDYLCIMDEDIMKLFSNTI